MFLKRFLFDSFKNRPVFFTYKEKNYNVKVFLLVSFTYDELDSLIRTNGLIG